MAAQAATLNRMTLCGGLSVSTLVIAGGILVAGNAITYAQAQNDRQDGQWCAYFSNGVTNCGFTTFEECLAEIRGKTGLCDRNPKSSPDRRRRRH